jgi:hypothetical protein
VSAESASALSGLGMACLSEKHEGDLCSYVGTHDGTLACRVQTDRTVYHVLSISSAVLDAHADN